MPIADDRLFEIAAELARRPGNEAVRTSVCALLTEASGRSFVARLLDQT
ncbi:MAG: hypothetical protein ACYC8V_02680 [Caulobacteraceae bacterium]